MLRRSIVKRTVLISLLKLFYILHHCFKIVPVFPNIRLLIGLVLLRVSTIVIQKRCKLLFVDKNFCKIRELCLHLLVIVVIRNKRVHEQRDSIQQFF